MGYKLLGYVVWHGGKWYVRRRYGGMVSSRTVLAAGTVGAAIAVLLVAGAKRS